MYGKCCDYMVTRRYRSYKKCFERKCDIDFDLVHRIYGVRKCKQIEIHTPLCIVCYILDVHALSSSSQSILKLEIPIDKLNNDEICIIIYTLSVDEMFARRKCCNISRILLLNGIFNRISNIFLFTHNWTCKRKGLDISRLCKRFYFFSCM